MTSSNQASFVAETNEVILPKYQNEFKFWDFNSPSVAEDSFLTLTLYYHQDTKHCDCICGSKTYVNVNEFPEHQTAKLLYDGTTLLQGIFYS